MPRSGFRRLALAGSLWLVSLTGCLYGFAGGGLPAHVKTMAVLPFDNETTSPELQRELFELMRREMQGRLGVREASESRADALIRGTIRRYETDVPIGFSADPAQATSARRKLQISVDVEIVDQTTGKMLWERKGLTADADYAERAEPQGRRQAIERLVRDMVEGAQSQW